MVRCLPVGTKFADLVNKINGAAGIITGGVITRCARRGVRSLVAHKTESDAQTCGVKSVYCAAAIVILNSKERSFGDGQFAAIRLTVALKSILTETTTAMVGGALVGAISPGSHTHAVLATTIRITTGFCNTAKPAAAVTVLTITTVSNAVSLTSAVAETIHTSGA